MRCWPKRDPIREAQRLYERGDRALQSGDYCAHLLRPRQAGRLYRTAALAFEDAAEAYIKIGEGLNLPDDAHDAVRAYHAGVHALVAAQRHSRRMRMRKAARRYRDAANSFKVAAFAFRARVEQS